MKTTLLLVLFLIGGVVGFGQDLATTVTFDSPVAYESDEDAVLKAANYVFSNPFVDGDKERIEATATVVKWMEGTPDYSFIILPEVMDITKKNKNLFGYYIVGIAKVALENEGKMLMPEEMHAKTIDLLKEYCANEENNMKATKALKKCEVK